MSALELLLTSPRVSFATSSERRFPGGAPSLVSTTLIRAPNGKVASHEECIIDEFDSGVVYYVLSIVFHDGPTAEKMRKLIAVACEGPDDKPGPIFFDSSYSKGRLDFSTNCFARVQEVLSGIYLELFGKVLGEDALACCVPPEDRCAPPQVEEAQG